MPPRQLQVVRLIAQGYRNDEIATALTIGLQTVKNHVHMMLRRLGLRNHVELIGFARRQGLL